MAVVEFPCDTLVSPGIFQVKYKVGTLVYALVKGVIVEGVVEGYFGHITPDKNLSEFGMEGGAAAASVSQVGYAVTYYVPNPQYPGSFVRQAQLLDEDEIFTSLQDVWNYFLQHNYLALPVEFRPKSDDNAEEVTD